MEIRVYNDFMCTPIKGGRKYEMELEDGKATVTNFMFGGGFVVNYFDLDTAYLTNQDRVGDMDYLMINANLYGRYCFNTSQIKPQYRNPGMAHIHHPANQREFIHIPTHRYIGLSIGLDRKAFRPLWGDPCEKVISALEGKYCPDTGKSIVLSDRIMTELYALKRILDDSDEMDEGIVHVLVSDIVHELYLSERAEFVDLNGTIDTCPEDVVLMRIMSETSAANIEDICLEEGFDRFEICKRFRRMYGATPYAYQKHYRLIQASSMLLLGERNMGRVAEAVGYSAENKFAMAFRKEFGYRPKHFDEGFGNPLRRNPS